MTQNVQNEIESLAESISHFRSCIRTYRECSLNSDKGKYIVSSTVHAIDFDMLTKWLYKGRNRPQSADTLNIANDEIFLIEFKDGNIVIPDKKRSGLIKNVIGKINSSDEIICSDLLRCDDEDSVNLNFYLVVSAFEMDIDPIATIQAELSQHGDDNAYHQMLFSEVLPDLKEGVIEQEHFREVDIWYAELFDLHLQQKNISDINKQIQIA